MSVVNRHRCVVGALVYEQSRHSTSVVPDRGCTTRIRPRSVAWPPRVACVFAALTIACHADQGPTEPRLSRDWLAGNALNAVGPDGRFLVPIVQRHPNVEVTADQAAKIATLWSHTTGQWIRSAFEQDRGAPVDPRKVEQCGRIFYADTPYQDLPATASHFVNTIYGAWWLVTLCDGAGPAISMAVSAYSTNLKIVNGVVTGIGNELFAVGIPTKLPSVPMSPEEATQIAATQTGARISEPPMLILGPRESPQTAKWLITLDRPITIRGTHSGVTRTTTTILVGFETTFWTKAIQANDPTAPRFIMSADPAAVAPGQPAPRLDVAARPGFSVAIERVEVVKP